MHSLLHTICAHFSVMFYSFMVLYGLQAALLIIISTLVFGNYLLRTICIVYLAFIYYERDRGETGGRGFGFESWPSFAAYFPIKIVKTVDMAANKNYLIVSVPHGALCFGCIGIVAKRLEWNQLFPGLRPRLVTLNTLLRIPFLREMLLSLGASSVSPDNLQSLLLQSNDPIHPINNDGYSGNAVVIVPGGAREMTFTKLRQYSVRIKDRKGFIRIALQTGAPIVPAIPFGEVDLFDTHELTGIIGFIWKIYQSCVEYAYNNPPTLYKGRFTYDFGLLPRRCPIHFVIGAPINIERNIQPTEEEIDELHKRVCDEIINLFETHKSKYIEASENVQLTIE